MKRAWCVGKTQCTKAQFSVSSSTAQAFAHSDTAVLLHAQCTSSASYALVAKLQCCRTSGGLCSHSLSNQPQATHLTWTERMLHVSFSSWPVAPAALGLASARQRLLGALTQGQGVLVRGGAAPAAPALRCAGAPTGTPRSPTSRQCCKTRYFSARQPDGVRPRSLQQHVQIERWRTSSVQQVELEGCRRTMAACARGRALLPIPLPRAILSANSAYDLVT